MAKGPILSPFRTFVQFSIRISKTRTNYWAEMILDIFLSIMMISAGVYLAPSSWTLIVATVLIGLLVFSFIEYFFHRWMFHVGQSILVEGHSNHHANPRGYDALPFYLPMLIFSVLLGISSLLLPWSVSLLLIGAMMFGYILYGSCHFIIHHYRFKSRILQTWAAYHHVHHVHPDKNFGVTSPLWDKLLGTFYMPGRRQQS